jgi:FkbM family methyltransferase
MNIVFDIGANDGEDSIWRAMNGDFVFAFEPHPGFCNIINSKIKNLPNYTLTCKAVSDFSGRHSFNILKSEDCSSLSDINEKNNWNNVKLDNIDKIEVDVITLENFIIENNIKRIDWLHCDAQGHDLNVLIGLNNFYKIVKAGVLETVNYKNNTLYKDQYTLEDVKKWMFDKGFIIEKMAPSDWGPRPETWEPIDVSNFNEINVFFTNPNFFPL